MLKLQSPISKSVHSGPGKALLPNFPMARLELFVQLSQWKEAAAVPLLSVPVHGKPDRLMPDSSILGGASNAPSVRSA